MTCWRFAGPSRPPPSRAQRACSPEAVVSGSWPSAAIVSVRSAMAGVVSTGTSSKSNPLIVGATDPNQLGTRHLEPVHGHPLDHWRAESGAPSHPPTFSATRRTWAHRTPSSSPSATSSIAGSVERGYHAPSKAPLAKPLLGFRPRRTEQPGPAEPSVST